MLVCAYNGKIDESQAMFVKIRAARRERIQADRMLRKLRSLAAAAAAAAVVAASSLSELALADVDTAPDGTPARQLLLTDSVRIKPDVFNLFCSLFHVRLYAIDLCPRHACTVMIVVTVPDLLPTRSPPYIAQRVIY